MPAVTTGAITPWRTRISRGRPTARETRWRAVTTFVPSLVAPSTGLLPATFRSGKADGVEQPPAHPRRVGEFGGPAGQEDKRGLRHIFGHGLIAPDLAQGG